MTYEPPILNGERAVPTVCQVCGVPIGWRSPGPVRDDVNTYCYDCAPIELAEAAMRNRPEESPDA